MSRRPSFAAVVAVAAGPLFFSACAGGAVADYQLVGSGGTPHSGTQADSPNAQEFVDVPVKGVARRGENISLVFDSPYCAYDTRWDVYATPSGDQAETVLRLREHPDNAVADCSLENHETQVAGAAAAALANPNATVVDAGGAVIASPDNQEVETFRFVGKQTTALGDGRARVVGAELAPNGTDMVLIVDAPGCSPQGLRWEFRGVEVPGQPWTSRGIVTVQGDAGAAQECGMANDLKVVWVRDADASTAMLPYLLTGRLVTAGVDGESVVTGTDYRVEDGDSFIFGSGVVFSGAAAS